MPGNSFIPLPRNPLSFIKQGEESPVADKLIRIVNVLIYNCYKMVILSVYL
ncbi:hypothetical protein FM107_13415 [Sphingobacterium sp. JB170]|nr:hypothetical protein FM107_13415 [Sphingobacterium sp. JB170]